MEGRGDGEEQDCCEGVRVEVEGRSKNVVGVGGGRKWRGGGPW